MKPCAAAGTIAATSIATATNRQRLAATSGARAALANRQQGNNLATTIGPCAIDLSCSRQPVIQNFNADLNTSSSDRQHDQRFRSCPAHFPTPVGFRHRDHNAEILELDVRLISRSRGLLNTVSPG